MLGGLRHGRTSARPWPSGSTTASGQSGPGDGPGPGRGPGGGRRQGGAADRPRPGHADLTGMQKYGFAEARPVLERASARETAARVAAGAAAKALLAQVGCRAQPRGPAGAGGHPVAGRAHPGRPGGDRRLARPLPGRGGRGGDGGRGRRGQGGRRHPRRGVRGGRPRPAPRPRVVCPLGPQARRPPGRGPDEHPGHQGGRGRRRLRHRRPAPASGPTTRSCPGPRQAPFGGAPGGPGGSRAACRPARPCGCGRP